MRPVPVGLIGELYLGGDGLARSYLNRPALTAERFLPNPFSHLAGARLFKTGDLARYLPDGSIEFVGRADQQVKLRGFRIELGEIEATLANHPAIAECVAAVLSDVEEEQRIVAYIVPSNGQVEASALSRYLRQRLPEHMVPSSYNVLEKLPLTPNGKVDRKALPAQESSRPEMSRPFIAARTPEETQVADIWAKTLRLEQVSIHDNFFELGGHSLLATQVVSRLRHVFSVEVPLRALFESPTVAGMTERLAAARRGEQPFAVSLQEATQPGAVSYYVVDFVNQTAQ
jgi:acyl carrier protein